MIKIFLLIIFSFLLVNCSLNENSKIWNKKNNVSDKNKKIEIILDEKKETPRELNSEIKIGLLKTNLNKTIYNNSNNYGAQSYSGKLNKIGIFKFKKLDEVYELNFKPLFLEDGLVFFDKNGSIIKYDLIGKILWKRNYYNKLEKKSNPRLSFSKKKII